MKKRILFYYMLGFPSGGSDNSLFYHLINLDKSLFEPIVFFNQPSFHKDKLDEIGIKTIIITLYKEKSHSNLVSGSTKKRKNIYINYLKANFGREIKAIYKSIPQAKIVYKLLKDLEIDLIHTNFNLSRCRTAIIAGILRRIPIVAHNRGLSDLLKIDRFLSKFIKKIICISEFVKEEYVKFGISENKCVVIYNGVDTERFKPSKKVKDDKIVITSVGRLEEWKGQKILIEAASLIIPNFSNIEFWIIGDGPEKQNLGLLSKRLNLSNNIKIWGKIDNIAEFLQRTNIFVHTSIIPEPFGRVIIEAMATGLPVISTNIGGPKEIIIDGQDGYLLPPGNPKILAAKILYLIKNPKVRHQVGKNALMTVRDRFDIKITNKKIVDLYDTV